MIANSGSVPDRQPWLIAPAVAVMNRLTYPRKFALVSLLFVTPLAFFMGLLISEMDARIEFTRKEIQGIRYLRPLRQLFEHVLQSRALAHAYGNGKVSLRTGLIGKQAEITEDLETLRAIEREVGHNLRTTSKHNALQENARFLREKLLKLETGDSDELHRQLLAGSHDLGAYVGDTSNLILDPDLDSYYLVEATFISLSGGQDLLALASSLGKGVVKGRTPTGEERTEFISLSSLLRSNVEATRRGLDAAFRNNSAANLKADLGPTLRAHLVATDALLNAIDGEVIRSEAIAIQPADYDRLVQKSLEANYSLWDRAVVSLEGLLHARIDGLTRNKHLIEAFAAVMLLSAAYLLLAIYLGVLSTVRRLKEASERMLGGSVVQHVILETRDELGQVATAFNNIATRLRAEWVQAREESTRARAAEAEVRVAKDAAEQATQAKSTFLATMSHEIRTPMNAIIGMTELTLDTDLTPEQRQYLELVKESSESLLTLINDILDLSKIEAGKLDLESIDFSLHESLGNTMKALALRAHKKRLELAYHIAPDVPETLVGDPGRLRQIVVNLVGNAIKFTEHGEVVVHVEKESQTADEVCLHFRVTDTGVGIPRERQDLIFDAFIQADSSTTRQYGGTGLGLTISSRLIALMRGRVWVESEAGQGSTFHFTMRLGVRKAPGITRDSAGSTLVDNLPVLVVDDNATNRLILEEILTKWRMRPKAVADGPSALAEMKRAAAAGDPYALVLADAMMPGMDGFTLLEQIKAHPELARSTLMMLSSADQSGDVDRCRRMGVNAYLVKPIKRSELLDAIVTSLGTSGVADGRGDLANRVSRLEPGDLPAPSRGLRILLVEDNPVNQTLATILLEKRGHKVIVACNGKEGLAAWEKQEFDLILMDVQMPEMDGLEVTACIRARERGTGRHIPIVAMTAHAIKGDREHCLQAGMDGYVSKPIEVGDLFRAIADVVPKTTAGFMAPEGLSEATPPPNGSEGVLPDRNALLQRVGGSWEKVEKIVAVFQGEVSRSMAEIRAAIDRGDATRIERTAHSLKGAIGVFGKSAAYNAAETLESMGYAGDLTEIGDVYHSLEKRVHELELALAEIVPRSNNR
ncbi:response regulator [Singulisphaera acidiphila]|uniref:Sensory/regulatory protein RpfC n=1 Tax=Singulisphaera acidiphila (strain ATCC BAA-1392 / DSM 18658 / VKM B-2454 / MOB10) TaxID=886293 RepID=L0DSV2_SINAD|nr:response regulator [Singulisphaera acidiphila]AGA31441.1 signal transduction histidine kinase [Singulisphaera acidiphila DSM 18658]